MKEVKKNIKENKQLMIIKIRMWWNIKDING